MGPKKLDFDSQHAGTHLVILGGIHGNETCGPHALQKIISELRSASLKLIAGKLTIVPVCNPRALATNARYIEQNLNRVFELHADPQTYEQDLANEITPWVKGADAMLDLHSMQSSGEPFVFLNAPTPESRALCEAVGIPVILRGWPEVYAAHPELLSSCTQTFADRHSMPNALVECGSHEDPLADIVAYDAVKGALQHFGLIEGQRPEPAPIRHIQMTQLFIRKSEQDFFPKVWKNFEPFQKGSLLATRASGEAILAEKDGVMILPSPISAVGTEWFYVGHHIN